GPVLRRLHHDFPARDRMGRDRQSHSEGSGELPHGGLGQLPDGHRGDGSGIFPGPARPPRSGEITVNFRILFAALGLLPLGMLAQNVGPEPLAIPVPEIRTPLAPMPGVKDLPARAGMPDVLTMNDGTKVT